MFPLLSEILAFVSMASRVASRPLTSQVTFVVLALAICSLATIAGFGALAMTNADREALVSQRTFAANGLAEQVEATTEQQQSVTVWDDAVTAAKSGDDAWMAENLSTWMYSYYGHDRVFVLDELNRPVHAMVGGELVDRSAYTQVESSVGRLVDQLRLLMMQVATGERTAARLLAEDLVSIDGKPAIVSVMPIVPSSDRVSQDTGTEYLHVTVQLVDDTLIGKIASQYQLKDARLLPLADEGDTSASMPLVDSSGAILGYVGWERDRPGLSFIAKTAPALALGALLSAGLLWFLLRRLRRASAQLERSQDETEFLAFHDTLTGLPNRALFDDRLQRAHVAVQGGGRLALLYVDLDRFKIVNDVLGHGAGDQLLVGAAKRMR